MKAASSLLPLGALALLVTSAACGDDTSAPGVSSGPGSGGGQGEAGGSTASSSSSSASTGAGGATSSSSGPGGSTSSSGGEGGEGGGGGEGGRPPLDGCTTVAIERPFQLREGVWSFLVAPPVGDPARDVLHVRVVGDEEGLIDLGAGDNRSSSGCVGCVSFEEDLSLFTDEDPERRFFQWSGRLDVERDGGANGGARLAFEGVTLVESTQEPGGIDLLPVEGGACIAIVDATLHGGVPEAWTGFPGGYAELVRCDCEAGAPDPDCDEPDLPITGCGSTLAVGDRAPTCSPEGTCVLPVAWTCAPGQWNDGETCDCACGAPDPDCFLVGDLPPVAGCEEGATCRDGACVVIPDAWSCPAEQFAAGDRCDCECGAYDPDCTTFDGLDCGSEQGCTLAGTCGVAATWTCGDETFGDGAICDCGCGFFDPDCDDTQLPVVGCDDGEGCGVGGVCAPRAPNDLCADAIPLVEGWTTVSKVGAGDDMDPGVLGCTPYPAAGGDVFFSIALEAGQTLIAYAMNPRRDQGLFADPSLYVVTDCDAVESCLEGSDTGNAGTEELVFTADQAVDLRLVVDQGAEGTRPDELELWIDVE